MASNSYVLFERSPLAVAGDNTRRFMATAPHSDYRPDIDGLRAVAVIAVILFHAGVYGASGGFVGVDVFFVISGFLISRLILRDLEHETFSLAHFYARRVRRIFPALILVLAAVFVAGWFLLLPEEYARLSVRTVAGGIFASNIVEWRDSGYFGTSTHNRPLLHLWSLGVEEQFYLVWPLLLAGAWRARRRVGLVVALAVAISLTLNLVTTSRDATSAFFLPHTRLWELGIGSLLALAVPAGLTRGSVAHTLSCTGAIAVAMAMITMGSVAAYPGIWAGIPVSATAALIASGPDALVNRALAWRPLVWLGLISYPLYLWHWPMLSFAWVSDGGAPTPRTLASALTLSAVLAALTYLLVERPVHGVRRLPRLAVLLVCLMCVVVAGGAIVASGDGVPARLPPALRALGTTTYAYAGEYRESSCFLTPDQASFDARCEPPSGSQPLVLLWGDSHAAHLYPGLRALSSARGFRLAQYTASACPPILEIYVSQRPFCRAINDGVRRTIDRLHPDVIIVSATWFAYADDPMVFERFEKTLATLLPNHRARVIVIGPVPFWSDTPARLIFNTYSGHRLAGVPTRLPNGVTENVRSSDATLRAIAERAGASYVSALNVFCDPTGCLVSIEEDGRTDLTAWDSGHLTTVASIRLARAIDATVGIASAAP